MPKKDLEGQVSMPVNHRKIASTAITNVINQWIWQDEFANVDEHN
jgi:hypothetical protein